jgi:hypothetical protein
MNNPDDIASKQPRSGLQHRMNDIQVEFLPAESLPTFRRTGPSSWDVPGTEITLNYCPVNCWFVAYQGSRGLFTARTLAEADELLQGLLHQREAL